MKEHHSVEQATAAEGPAVSRRALTAGAIWSLPVIATIGAAPAMAASSFGATYAGSVVTSTATQGSWNGTQNNALSSPDNAYARFTATSSGNPAGTLTLGGFGLTGTLNTGETLTVRVYNHYRTISAVTISATATVGGQTVTATLTGSAGVYTTSSFTFTATAARALSTLQVAVAIAGLTNGAHAEFDAVSVQHTH